MKSCKLLIFRARRVFLARVIFLLLTLSLSTGPTLGAPSVATAMGPSWFLIDPATISQEAKVTASDAEAGDAFGRAVSLSGNTLVVGAHLEDSNGNNAGAVYVFERNQTGTNNWGQVRKIQANDAQADDRFGFSVSLSGDTLAVGAYWEDSSASDAGAVYIFERNQGGSNNWGQTAKISASDAEANDAFGYSVSLSGDTLAVSAYVEDTGGIDAGAAYVFERNQGGLGNWGEVTKIQADDIAESDNFGQSVSLSGNTLIVGAPRQDSGGSDAGAAYIFERDQGGTDNWGQVAKLLSSTAQPNDRFGQSVSISADTLVVGAYLADAGGNDAGAAYVFARDQGGTDQWGEVANLLADDAAASDRFGMSVSISGDTLIVGAYLEETVATNAGASYLFERNQGGTDDWGQVAKIESDDAETDDNFGISVSLSGNTLAVGAHQEDTGGSDAGAAYIFNLVPESDLSIRKTATPTSGVVPGTSVTYTIAFSNTGSGLATNVVISDSVPLTVSGVTAQTALDSGVIITQTGSAPDFAWQVSDLAAGAGGVITLTGSISATLNADTLINNTATITDSKDSTPANNLSTATTAVSVPRVQFSAGTYNVAEANGFATITLTLNVANPYAAVNVRVQSSNGTALAGSDYTAISQTVSIPAGSTQVTLTVPVTNDAIDESNESLNLTLVSPTGAALGATNAATVTILDNDTAGVTVSPTSGLVTTEAGGTATFSVVLNSEPTATVTVNVASSDSSEGTVSAAQLTFTAANWDTAQTVTVTGVNDDVDDGNIAYTVVTTVASADSLYNGIAAADVSVSNTDDDSAGVIVNPTSGLVTTEAGGTASFTVVLNSEPTAAVTVNVVSSDTSEGTVSPTQLTFTAANWDTAQTVTVTGANDDVDDGNIAYTVVTSVTSTDSLYNGIAAADVSVTNTDDDTAGVIVNPTSGLVTTEAGGAASFTVVLNSEPTATVTVNVASSDTSEGTVSAAQLTFTAANWDTAQTVTVTGANDDVDDGNIAYTIVTSVTSADSLYNGIAAADISASNTDDDTAGVIVSPTSGLVTTEAGGTASFTVVFNSEPTGTVTVTLASSDTSEGTVSPTQLTFTAANWDTARTVTVTGANDDVDDGNIAYTVVTSVTSTDSLYNGIAAADVSASNTDDDTAGVIVSPTSGLVTTEAGGTTSFTVVLNSEPTAAVTVALFSSDSSEGTVNPTQLTFTAANWDTARTVTVTGVNDDVDDGNIAYTVVTSVASADSLYNGIAAADVSAINTDDDSAGVIVNPTSGLVTTEAGGTASFTVVLNSEPTASVTVNVASSDTSEGTVSAAQLTFTAANWDTARTVTVTGANDDVDDGNIAYTVVTSVASADSLYNGIAAADVSVTNTDDDTAGVIVNPNSGLVTTEAGGTASFTVVLNSEPTGTVTVTLASSDTSEGTVNPAQLTFTAANWDTVRTVTITGANDDVDDGNIAYTVVTSVASADSLYNGIAAADVSATNTDDDSAGVIVSPTSGLVTTEVGGTATFTVGLNSEPTGTVTVTLASSDTSEGTVSAAQLTFTAANWDTARTVTVTGANDDVDDGNIAYTVVTSVTSTDSLYNGIAAADVSATNTDDDSAGVIVSPTSGLVTTEAGGAASFTVVLNSEPTATVTVNVASSDTSEGTVSPTQLTFTAANWDTARTVTVTGINDDVDDGNIAYTVVTTVASADSLYNGIAAADVSVTNTDDDTAGVIVSPTSGLVTTEAGGTATFTVVLNSEPTASVTVNVASSDTSEGTVSPAQLTFTAANWETAQTVTVTGANDDVDDGNIAYTVVTSVASADSLYNGIAAADVSVTNTDDDTAGVIVSPTSGLVTTEAGGTASFTVGLNSEPTGPVTVTLASSDTSEGTVSPTQLTFTAANWDTAQTVTVTGINDDVDDGNIAYTVVTTVASTDNLYHGIATTGATVTNTDDDSAGVIVNPISGLITTEAGGTNRFSVVLNSEPTAAVIVNVASSDTSEGIVSNPAQLTFTPANWDTAQTVTVAGVDDSVDDGDVGYTIVTTVSSADSVYNRIAAADVSVTNLNNDRADVLIDPTSGLFTSEAGDADSFFVVLAAQPTSIVTVTLTSSDSGEGRVNRPQLIFNASNWSSAQLVTITGVDDNVDDGDVGYTIVTTISSADTAYNGFAADDISVTNADDDRAGVSVAPSRGLVTTEAGGAASFTVVLNSEPTGTVTVTVASSDASEGTVSPTQVIFTAANWDTAQTVTASGVNDAFDDGDVAYSIVTTVSSDDGRYNGIAAVDVGVVNIDDDSATVGAGVTVSPTSGLVTSEAGGSDSFGVVLNTRPNGLVVVTLSSSNSAEGTVQPTQLTFNAGNWDTVQTVTVTGVDDGNGDENADGNVSYFIVITVSSTDPSYNGIAAADVSVTNIDNDGAAGNAGVTVNPTGGLITSEAGDEDSFSVVLDAKPSGSVVVTLASSDPGEGMADPTQLFFDAGNWDTAQTVTVIGMDDDSDDGDASYTIVTSVSSGDANYSGLGVDDVSVTNTDDDSAAVIIAPSTVRASEPGATEAYAVVLASKPTAMVTVTVQTDAQTTATPTQLVFRPDNWSAQQTVTAGAVEDSVNEGPHSGVIRHSVHSTDAGYDGIAAADVIVRIADRPTLSITKTVEPAGAVARGSVLTYTVTLSNSGEVAAENVVLTDTLPTQVAFGVFVRGSGAQQGGDLVTWNGAVPGQNVIKIVFTVVHNGGYNETFSNSATVRYGADQGSASVETIVLGAPVLSITKTADSAVVDEGKVVNYTVVIHNHGDSAATNITVSDDRMGVLAKGVTLAVGQQMTYTYALTPNDGPQVFVNTAAVTSTQTAMLTASVSVAVNNVAPTLAAGGAQMVTLGKPVTVTAQIDDPGRADTHTARVDWNDGGATEAAAVDGTTVRASHVYTDVGIYAVSLCVSDDDGGQECGVVDVFVEDDPTGVGNPPILSNPGNQQNTIGDEVTLEIFADDEDGDPLSFSAEGLPAGLSIDSTSGVIAGTLTREGDYQVKVQVSDGKESVSVFFVWRVLPPSGQYKQYLPTISK